MNIRSALFLYVLLAIGELVIVTFPALFAWQEFLFKPFLMPVLLVAGLALAQQKRVNFPARLFLALFFGWVGDVALLLGGHNKVFFLLGLGAFLIGHIFYILLNFTAVKPLKINIKFCFAVLPMLGFSVILLKLSANSAAGLFLPIMAYSLALTVVYISSLSLYWRIDKVNWLFIFGGSVLFIASDSMIAIKRFISPFPLAGFAIMATYIIAQYMLVKGNIGKISPTNPEMVA